MILTVIRNRRLALTTAVLAMALTLCLAASARAGEWAQATCSDGGEPVSTEGWAPGTVGGYLSIVEPGDTCAQVGGSLSLRDEVGYQLANSGPMWVYSAPAYSTIQGGSITLSLASPGGQAYLSTPNNSTEVRELVVMCTELCKTVKENTLTDYYHGGSRLYAVTECIPPSGKEYCSSGLDAQMNIKSATILLSNEAKPTAAGFAGTLLNNPASGTASLSFTAHDEHGPGVYHATVQIDGHTMWSATPNLSEGKCVAHGTYNGALKFHNLQPCPQETEVHTEIQTSELAEGQHTLKVEIEDAAGNKATVYTGPITIDNQPPVVTPPIVSVIPPSRGAPNGEPASERATLTLAGRQPKAFAREQTRSAVVLAGRLTAPTGAPIKGAQVQLLQQVIGSAAATPIASATTRPDGTWTLKAPAGPSRLLRIAYYSHTLDSTPAATLDVHESVQGVVSMHAPRRARLGRALVFRGQLAGGYVPPGGESVQMEILYAGRWRTIEVLPTSSRGAWTYKYVFTLGVGTSYLFRAVTVPNGGYPFLSTHSKPVRVTVER
jgi:Bacterial Ig-like domain